MQNVTTIQTLTDLARSFSEARQWSQFHSPKNLAMALAGEVGELNALLQWVDDSDDWSSQNRARLSGEIADIAIYLLLLAERAEIDVAEAVRDKININEDRYPVDKARGSIKKYNELSEE